MKGLFALLIALVSVPVDARPGDAVFSWISYQGRDPVDDAIPIKPGQYRNPILPGFQPDPSIVRVGADYYLVNSSFAFYPGLPIYHSRDLVRWTQVGNAIDRPDMFDFTGLGVARAVFAPTIRHHNGRFYIVNTCIECGSSYIISAMDPRGPWSTPTMLSLDGLDPDLFFDDADPAAGRAWIAYSGPPDGPPHYDGHRAIWIQELDASALKIKGPKTLLVNGGVHFADKPIWTEGPHIVKRDGWYYLFAAEGGTAEGHSETVYRSRSVTGPYTAGPVNPILTQRALDPARQFPVYATGHSDFVTTPDGRWWTVFLGTRPYKANLSNLGRETFLLPVRWPTGSWPVIVSAGTAVPQAATQAMPGRTAVAYPAAWRDTFDAPTLALDWLMLRTPKTRWFSVGKGALTLTPRADTLSGVGNPSFLSKRQRHANARVEVMMQFTPRAVGDRAGLAAFADESHHYFIGIVRGASGTKIMVAVRNGSADPLEGRVLASTAYTADGAAIRLRIEARGPDYGFAYAAAGGVWHWLVPHADGRVLASETSNQFTGTVIGLYAAKSATGY